MDKSTAVQVYVNQIVVDIERSVAVTELAISGVRQLAATYASGPRSPENPDPMIFIGHGDPNQGTPHHGRVRMSELQAFAQRGSGAEVALSQQWLMATYSRWELEQRPAIAKLLEVPTAQVMCDLYGDLRLLRNDVAHHGGRVQDAAGRLVVLTRFQPGESIAFDAADYITVRDNVAVYLAC